jgi:hypothetical protein
MSVIVLTAFLRPVGMPYVHDVVVVNPSSEKNLQLHPFPGDDKHFHVSFSKSQVNIFVYYSHQFYFHIIYIYLILLIYNEIRGEAHFLLLSLFLDPSFRPLKYVFLEFF